MAIPPIAKFFHNMLFCVDYDRKRGCCKNPNENTTSLIRRFTKRVQGAGILRRVRSLRYSERSSLKIHAQKTRVEADEETNGI